MTLFWRRGLSIQTGQIIFLVLEIYTTFFNEDIDKRKKKERIST